MQKSTRRLLQVTALVVAVCAAGVLANAIRAAATAKTSFAETRDRQLLELTARRGQLDTELAAVRARMAAFPAQILAEEEKIRQADRIVAQLRELESTWDRLVGNPAQQKANAEQMSRMEQLKQEAADRIARLKDESRRTGWEKDGLDIDHARVEGQIRALQRNRSAVMHYLGLGWQAGRRWVIWALVMNAAVIALFVVRSRRMAGNERG